MDKFLQSSIWKLRKTKRIFNFRKAFIFSFYRAESPSRCLYSSMNRLKKVFFSLFFLYWFAMFKEIILMYFTSVRFVTEILVTWSPQRINSSSTLLPIDRIVINPKLKDFQPFKKEKKKNLVITCSAVSVLWKLWEKKKLLVTSNFSFFHSVFYPFGNPSAIFIIFEVVVTKLFQFGKVWKKFGGWEWVNLNVARST